MSKTKTSTSPEALVALEADGATDVGSVGGKAAALAHAVRAGLPVLPGAVVPVSAVDHLDDGTRDAIWRELSDDGEHQLVARSSSPIEDTADESMAGRFESVTGIGSAEELGDAFGVVRRSADEIAEQRGEDVPVAVLLQRHVEPQLGGVLFTVDPRTGRDHVVVSVAQGPESLVSGEEAGVTITLDRSDASEIAREGDGPTPDAAALRELVDLARRVEELFDAPQDVEWAIDADGKLWLLQSRPVTEIGRPSRPVAETDGRIYGPGPVAETFPDPLAPLERDLWVPPLRKALTIAFRHIGGGKEKEVDESQVLVWIDGRVAVDLGLFESSPREDSTWQKIDPRRGFRRLRSAWHAGRLRASVPRLAGQVCSQIDEHLSAAPPLEELTDRQLLGLLDRGQAALTSIHAHEVLVGILVGVEQPGLTGASVALRVLSTARSDGHDDDQIVRDHPIVLALTGPRIRTSPELPATPELPTRPVSGEDDDELAILREALRLRARWVQELQARAVLELARRLHDRGQMSEPEQVRWLELAELRAAVEDRASLIDLGKEERRVEGRGLPAAFVLEDGEVVRIAGEGGGGGTGAGGGTGTGPVHLGDDPEPGDVLIVRTLDPALGSIVDSLGGLVAETGSILSHVAILARESGVPTVVAAEGVRDRFEEGQRVVVDGDEGTVRAEDDDDEEE